MKGRLFLDVIVGKCTAILKLFTGKDQTLLVWGNAFFILNFSLDIFNSVGGLNFEGDGFPSEGFDENLHSSSKSENKVKGRLFLNVVIREGAAVFELFAGENESLLVWGDSFFVLDFRFDIFNSVRGFDLEGNSFSGEGLDEDLHSSS